MGEGEKDRFYGSARQGGPRQTNGLKTVSPLGKNCGEFYSKKRGQTGFQTGIRTGANTHASLFGGVFSHQGWAWKKGSQVRIRVGASLHSSKLVFSGPRTRLGGPPSFWNEDCFIK